MSHCCVAHLYSFFFNDRVKYMSLIYPLPDIENYDKENHVENAAIKRCGTRE